MKPWCVHIKGPDDLIPMPDRATADRACARFLASWTRFLAGRDHNDGIEYDPQPAEVIEWPGPAEEHAQHLAELRANDPEGWLKEETTNV